MNVAKTKALISCAVIAYAKSLLSYDAAQLCFCSVGIRPLIAMAA